LTAGGRRAWITAAAIGIFAAAWLGSALIFRQDTEASVGIAAGLDAIALVLLAPLVPGPDTHPANATPEALAYGLDRMRDNVASLVTEQVSALTDRGTLAVPWRAGPNQVGFPATTAAPTTPVSSIATLLDSIEHGSQLIIFGEAQSGKTTLALRLAQALTSSQSAKQPILFALSTWNPGQNRLKPWMLEVIRNSYGLNARQELEAAEVALSKGMIIPIFDGLDEIEEKYLEVAAKAIYSLVQDSPAVLTSIPDSYTERAARLALRQANVIELCPISPKEVGRYLLDGPSNDESGWQKLSAYIVDNSGSAVAEALSSPLIAWLTKATYANDPIHAIQGVLRVDELLDTARFPDAKTIERHMLSHLAVTVFERRKSAPGTNNVPASSFRPEEAQLYLAFLASHALRRIVAFWEIRNYAPLVKISLIVAAIAGACIAFLGEKLPYLAGSTYLVLLAGCVFGFGWSRGYSNERARVNDPTRIGYGYIGQQDGSVYLHSDRLAKALAVACTAYGAGVISQEAYGRGFSWLFGFSGKEFGIGVLVATVLCYLVSNLGARLAARILRSRPDLDAKMGARADDPVNAVKSDERSGWTILFLSSLTLGAGDLIYHLIWLPTDSCWTVSMAPIGGVIATFMWSEWICFKAAHIWLASRERLPWQLILFLEECHDGGILRKTGNYYEFRHRRLQESLAEQSRGRLWSGWIV
jgi:NACHT domain